MQIKVETEIFKAQNIYRGVGLSVDWIHNLVYFNANNKIIVFNMTHTRYEFVVIEEADYIEDLSVNPLDSTIFYSTCNYDQQKGKIMKSSQDGYQKTILRDENIIQPKALTIDFALKKVIWIDHYSNIISSIDFDGNNFFTFGTFKSTSFNIFMDTFDDYIYWTGNCENSIFKTKLGVNATQLDYLITSEPNKFGSFKIIDSSLQPNSTNRCIYHNCSHLCIPININQYRCVCPQLSLRIVEKICRQSVSIQ